MKIRHHLSDQLLMAYSAGQLPEAFNLVVATHVSMCDECRARLASFDAVGGALIEEIDEIAMGEAALEAALARIDGLPQATRTEPLKTAGIFPAPLADYVGGDLSAVRWRRIGGGVKQAILPTGRSATARLLYIPAGVAVPDHGHRGMELTLVLQGAFADENDRFDRGDIEIADEEVEHTPVALAGEDCICLAATDAPLRFRGLVPRLAQPLFRI
ncbi:ChrR family anti-sigma-E factor [Tabrizicola sp. YIM 78059]|uniref:ChrR family anti-sigma-E factor n=1 Tax=Tabrizicola sp. YIM 78059 TaxID=2529861 RepID=UPI0010AA1226|nr:ChrR family anti-sigma-E factor [Tabrizicola sp. YIM 78059]